MKMLNPRRMLDFLKLQWTLLQLKRRRLVMELRCAWCGDSRELQLAHYRRTASDGIYVYDRLLVTIHCKQCRRDTTYEIEGMAVIGAPTRLMTGQIAEGIPAEVKSLVEEATRCFYAQAYRAVVALCRSAVEEALDQKNVPGRYLDDKITNARNSNPAILDEQQETQATAARLAGRNALHRGQQVNQTQAVLAVTSTVELVNHIAVQQPLPARQ